LEIAVVDRPGQEIDLVERADKRRPAADRLVDVDRGQCEGLEPPRKILRPLVDMVGGAVMEQVPDDLQAKLLGRLQRRQPARPVVAAVRLLDQVPA
jgi:hypothetical protein